MEGKSRYHFMNEKYMGTVDYELSMCPYVKVWFKMDLLPCILEQT